MTRVKSRWPVLRLLPQVIADMLLYKGRYFQSFFDKMNSCYENYSVPRRGWQDTLRIDAGG